MTRRALVLGAGGVLGYAWMVAALHNMEQTFGFDARSAELCVGTSAGAVAAALLGRGVPVEALLRHQRGVPGVNDPAIDWDYDTDSGEALPPRPGLRWGSPRLTLSALRHPRRLPAPAVLSGLLPLGRGTLTPLQAMVTGLGGDGWPDAPRPWIVALDYDAGRRVPFGREDAPEVPLADAVVASCAIPGWYAPVQIGGRRYVDGGTCSPASLNLLTRRGLDEVIVLAPMVSFAYDSPRSPILRAERRWRRGLSRRLLREAAAVRAGGTRVVMFAPGPEDLAALGANLMNPAPRRTVLETALRTTAAAMGARRSEVPQ